VIGNTIGIMQSCIFHDEEKKKKKKKEKEKKTKETEE
jgi:hypothetical protein